MIGGNMREGKSLARPKKDEEAEKKTTGGGNGNR